MKKHGSFLVLTKTLCVFVLLLSAVSFAGCGIIIGDSKEEKAYKSAIDSFINALDSKDASAISELFSPYVREQDKDLSEQINKLISVYDGPTDEVGWDGLLSGEASYEYGDVWKDADTIFPIRCGDTYYWCYLKLMYENTFDESKIGITQLDFYTADEFCISWYDENAKTVDSLGLEVYADKTIDDDIQCINGRPLKFNSDTKELNLDNVKSFFKSKQSFSEFKAQFGEPNAECIYTYYSLPQKNGDKRYLQLCIDCDTICGADIADNFGVVESIFPAEE